MQEAAFYEKLEGDRVRCSLCPHRCLIRSGRRGICGVRENRGGVLYALNYGRVSSWAFDPIEKKPLYHFYPGSSIFSLGTVGCSFHCEFCQNWQISRGEVADTFFLAPEELPKILKEKAPPGCIGVAYTYSEPLVWYEFVLAASRLVAQHGYKNVLVTNGFINPKPLQTLLPFVHAMNIDVKGFTDAFYHRVVHGRYQPVLRAAELAREAGCHIEITTLLIPGLNDSEEELERLTDWIADRLGPDTPLHFSRYFPNYKMELAPTPISTLKKARSIARRRLRYVYLGNVLDTEAATTYCPSCHNPVVERYGYQVTARGLRGRACASCGEKLPIVR